jgi:hypothetical protein
MCADVLVDSKHGERFDIFTKDFLQFIIENNLSLVFWIL